MYIHMVRYKVHEEFLKNFHNIIVISLKDEEERLEFLRDSKLDQKKLLLQHLKHCHLYFSIISILK